MWLSCDQTTFPQLYQELQLRDSALWSAYSRSSQCEQELPSFVCKKLSAFQQLLVVQATRPDRLQSAMTHFACAALGTLLLLCSSNEVNHLFAKCNVQMFVPWAFWNALSLSPFWRPFSRWTWVSQYQNASILDFIGANHDVCGGDNWSYKTCKPPVKMSPPTNQHPDFYRLDALPVAQPTVSKHWREMYFLIIRKWSDRFHLLKQVTK